MSVETNIGGVTIQDLENLANETTENETRKIQGLFLNTEINDLKKQISVQKVFLHTGDEYKYLKNIKDAEKCIVDAFNYVSKKLASINKYTTAIVSSTKPDYADSWHDIPIYLVCNHENFKEISDTFYSTTDFKYNRTDDNKEYEETPVPYLGIYDSSESGIKGDELKYQHRIFLWVDRIAKEGKDHDGFAILFKHVLLHELMHALMDVYNVKFTYNDFSKGQEEPLANALACHFDTEKNAKWLNDNFNSRQRPPYCWSIHYNDNDLLTLVKNWMTVKANCK